MPAEVVEEMKQLGLFGLSIPAEFGASTSPWRTSA